MLFNPISNALNQQVRVTTTARLHMGFFDLTGSVGRRFGGIGLAIDAPCTQVQVKESKDLIIDAKNCKNVTNIVEKLIKSFNLSKSFSVEVLQNIPEHAGLGSGTQMALAIGTALNHLFALNLSTTQIAAAAMRGKRSGIGIGAFVQGGFLLDAGKHTDKNDEDIPAIVARHIFPADWCVLLVMDAAHTGVHGAEELVAFQALKPATSSLRIMVDEHMLPAMQRADLLAFGEYMQQLQAYNGDYFAPIQGGRYASVDVAQALDWLQSKGVACVGQSSWGPTGFAILETRQQAERLQVQAQLMFADKPNISFKIVRGKNTGASITGLGVPELSANELIG
jgi:beta-ribofuranosylaminobenzene 5'-phosphate synthase